MPHNGRWDLKDLKGEEFNLFSTLAGLVLMLFIAYNQTEPLTNTYVHGVDTRNKNILYLTFL